MKKILIYYPNNKRTIAIESLLIELKKQGHNVWLLSNEDNYGELHKVLGLQGIKASAFNVSIKNPLIYYLKHINFLVHFIRKNKFDIVYSHIQRSNFIAVIAQYFCNSRFIICRHHSDINTKFKERFLDMVINKLAKTIVVPSKKVMNHMTLSEGVPRKKIRLINYGYNFNAYDKPDLKEAGIIKNNFSCNLLIIQVARLMPGKRYLELCLVIKTLFEKGYDIKLIALGEGEEEEKLKKFIQKNNLEKTIHLLGYKNNVIDYLYAADLVVLLSRSEASNSVIKEAALVKRPVIICNDVGDFDDYIEHGINGFKINKDDPKPELMKLIIDFYNNKYDTDALTENLYKKVIATFSIDNVAYKYDEFNNR